MFTHSLLTIINFKHVKFRLLFLSTFYLFFSSVSGFAQSGLIVAPTMLEFEGRERYSTLTLVNRGTEAHSYRISFINQAMLENGEMVPVDTPAENEGFAGNFLRYSPRQITLLPNRPQTVRVMLRMPGDAQDGEYRSHLLFQQLPDTSSPVSRETSGDGLGVSITAQFGITIPVFIRKGNLVATSTISEIENLVDNQGRTTLGFTITREGNKTVRGHISVKANGKEIGRMKGLPVYLSTKRRRVEIPLDENNIAGKNIQIEYRSRDRDGGDIIALAQKQY